MRDPGKIFSLNCYFHHLKTSPPLYLSKIQFFPICLLHLLNRERFSQTYAESFLRPSSFLMQAHSFPSNSLSPDSSTPFLQPFLSPKEPFLHKRQPGELLRLAFAFLIVALPQF